MQRYVRKAMKQSFCPYLLSSQLFKGLLAASIDRKDLYGRGIWGARRKVLGFFHKRSMEFFFIQVNKLLDLSYIRWKMKSKRAFGIVLTVLVAAMFAVPAIVSAEPPCQPTSLEVWKEVSACKVLVCGSMWKVTVSGKIYIQNDPVNPAYVLHVVDIVQAKWKNNPWTDLKTEILVSPTLVIPPGETEEILFSFYFYLSIAEYMEYKAYRNVVRVHLQNHPTGDRGYTHRVSFEIP